MLGTPPISTSLGSPPHQPLPSIFTSLVSKGTPRRYTTTVMARASQPRKPWLTLGVVNVCGDQHDFPKHLENLFPKFELDKKYSLEDHIDKFMLLVNLIKLEQKYVFCRLFPYTFEGKEST